MGKNIWNEEILDSKDYDDPNSVLYREVLKDNVLENGGSGDSKSGKMNAFYTKEGEFLGYDDKNEDKVYISTKGNYEYSLGITGEPDSKPNYESLRKHSTELDIKHSEFQNNAYLILHEGSCASNKTTLLWIAHTINNALKNTKYNRGKKTFNQLIKTGYSSASEKDKEKLLPITNINYLANSARYGLIDVLLENPDPTNNAYFWDGLDFISNYGGKTTVLQHPKFKQYISIEIPHNTIDTMIAFWEIDNNRRCVNVKSKILYESFEIPDVPPSSGYQENDFGLILNNNTLFWGSRYENLRPKATEKLKSTGMYGGTIFWTSYQ